MLATAVMVLGTVNCPAQVATRQASPDALEAAKTLDSLAKSPDLDAVLSAQLGDVATQAWTAIEDALRAKYPNISPEAVAALQTEFRRLNETFANEILNEVPQEYATQFTGPELRELIAFYRTGTGAKFVRVVQATQLQTIMKFRERMPALQEQTRGAFNAILRLYGHTP